MSERREGTDDCGISDEKLKSLARVLLPIIRNYLSTEEGKRNLAEWTAERQLNKTETKKESR